MNWEEQLGLKFTAFIAGVVGGIISLTFEAQLSFKRAITLILVGGSTAGYSFEFAHAYFAIKPQISGFFGFCIGLISMKLVNTLLSVGTMIQKDPSVLLSIPKFFQALKDGFNTDNSISSRDDSQSSTDIHTAGKGSDKEESAS